MAALFFNLLLSVQCAQFTFDSTLSSTHSAAIVSAIVSPDHTFFVTGAAEHNVKVWDYSTKALITTLTYLDVVTNINIDSVSNMIFISVIDGTVSIVDSSTFT
jgi:WD40 repeat protein